MSRFAVHFAARVVAVAAVAFVVGQAPAADDPKPAAAKQSPVSAQHVNKLIRQLGDKDYFVRQRAQDELARLGFDAFDALNAATTDEDLEIASRAKYLLRLMRVEWTTENDPPRVKALLRNYEFEDTRSREARMQGLAGLANGQGIAALCRLVRFEKTLLLSKAAAVALLGGQMGADPPDAATVAIVRNNLKGCKRPGAAWLMAWTRLGADPQAVMAQWAKLIDDEQAVLRRVPNESSREIVAGLTRFQIARLKKLGKTDEAMAAILRLVDLEQGNAGTLAELLDWLIDEKAWKAVDRLAQRFRVQLEREPTLLYMLAEAYARQDQKARAEETAKQALGLYPGKRQAELLHHLAAAQHLRARGQFAWARREYDHVIAQGGDAENDEIRAMAQAVLAEMLHDQGQDLDAAGVLQKLVEAIDSGKVTEAELGGRKPNEVRARMNHFFACHWLAKGDAAKQRDALDKALAADPTDVDVLIACYRLAGQPPEYRAKIVELIKKAAAALREQIAEDPENPSTYNQFAWLIANTEGDFDEALRNSQKSLELKPDEGGFFDTLGRCYFAKGDLENAVKNQAKAAELEPYSGLIHRQLELFRGKLEEKKRKAAGG
jgi:tetratricopeptide (TPR) repeat protein